MNELQTLAQSKLALAKVTLVLDDYDRRLLMKSPAAIFVCNRLLPGLDEWILLSLMAEKTDQVKILHPYPTSLPRSLRPSLIRPARKSLEDRFLRINFAKKVSKTVQKGSTIGLVIDFSDHPFGDFGKNLLRPQILKQLRKSRQNIVPVHLSADRLPGGLLRKGSPGGGVRDPVRRVLPLRTVKPA